jgi:F5/8 type C domain
MLRHELINVARGKKCHQSSTYGSHLADNNPNRVSGARSGTFSFHTGLDSQPFWCVDLEQVYPIDSILLFNRDDEEQDRAQTIIVESSIDGNAWSTIHRGIVFFGGIVTGSPLRIPLMSKLAARYIKLSLDYTQYLHLDQVEVYIHISDILFYHVCNKYGFDHDRMVIANLGELKFAPYKLNFHKSEDIFGDIQSIYVSAEGRLGNYVNQLMGATFCALRIGVNDIYIPNVGLIRLSQPVEIANIRFLPATLCNSCAGMALSGYFFGFNQYLSNEGLKSYGAQQAWIGEKYLRPLVIGALGPRNSAINVDTVVHFRAGDVFEDGGANTYYTQPPLSFYQIAVKYLLPINHLGRVTVMYEDKKNPSLCKFMDYLRSEEIDFVEQAASLADDVYILLKAENIVSSFGSFCAYVGILSTDIKRFVFFRNNAMEHMHKKNLTLIQFVDDGDYISQHDWHNSEAQLRIMVEYPAAKIKGPMARHL